MKDKSFRPLSLCRWLGLVALVLTLPALTYGQNPFPTPTPPPDPLAGVPVQVLDQQQVTIGTHTITFNRITPPVFPAATPLARPQAAPTTNQTSQAAPKKRAASRSPQGRSGGSTQSSQNNDGGAGEKAYKILFLSATIYDHQFTALRFYDGSSLGLRNR